MIVVVLTDCPPKLRGDLSKWLFEINTGVYVGNVSARVRELLWIRICDNICHGQATMVYSAPGEQKLEFCVHNTSWEIVDFDGIKLMRRPSVSYLEKSEENAEHIYEEGFSKAAKYEKGRRMQLARQKNRTPKDYVIIDIETTGLSHLSDEILEIAALRIQEGKPVGEFQVLIRSEKEIPERIQALTGITEQEREKGKELHLALKELLDFCVDSMLVCYNAAFDFKFIQAACKKSKLSVPRNQCIDTLILARKKLKGIKNYKLQTVAEYFSIQVTSAHRALRDCYITYGIFSKLNEI